MPHKVTVASLVGRAHARSAAGRRLQRGPPRADGRLEGTTLDGEGSSRAARAGHEVRGRRVFMVGAGGAAAATAFALAKHGAGGLTIANRTRAKAEDLAARVRAAYPSVEIATMEPGRARRRRERDVDRHAARGRVAGRPLLPWTRHGRGRRRPAARHGLSAGGRQARGRRPRGEPMLAAQIELLLDYMLWQDPLA
jgi:shikimate dehydrogenase